MKCQTCKSKINLRVNSKEIRKDGVIRYYYICRSCNTKRYKRYRQTKKGKENTYKASFKYYKNNPIRVRAWSRVRWKPNGILDTKKPCYCGEVKVDAHHPNPSEKERIYWLCRYHHKLTHSTEKYLRNFYMIE